MYTESIKKVKRSIFPIFFQHKTGNKIKFGVSGTGFFISRYGHFLTAHHVIQSVMEGAKLLYYGNIPDRHVRPVELKEVYSDPIRDIYIGKIERDYLPPVELILETPPIGNSVCLCGYPMAQVKKSPQGSINLSNVRQYWQPTFVVDYINAKNIGGRNYNGFYTQDISLPGMSGGPVFNLKGQVCGVDVAFMDRKIPRKNKPEIIVSNGIAIKLESIKDIFDIINKTGTLNSGN